MVGFLRYIKIGTIIILGLFSGFSNAQSAQIDTLIVVVKAPLAGGLTNKMYYPIISTGKSQIDSLINKQIKDRVTFEFEIDDIDSAVYQWAEEMIVDIYFEISYNNKGILSLNIWREGCAAYCSGYLHHFNFSLVTGKSLLLGDVLDTSTGFKEMVFIDFKTQYARELNSLKDRLSSEEGSLDSSDFNWAYEYYQSCYDSFGLNIFALYPDHVEVVRQCYLPHAIRALGPGMDLRYPYHEIKSYLKKDLKY